MELMAQLKKRDKQQKEMLNQQSKKIRGREKKIDEDGKISIELKKRHDIMQKKLQIVSKEKTDNMKQMKQLCGVFQKQRKALELSIRKNKKYEADTDFKDRQIAEKDQMKIQMQERVEHLTQQHEFIQKKHQRDIETLTLDIENRKLQLGREMQRLQAEATENNEAKVTLKQRVEECEDKIKELIKEFEVESKRHIKETNEIHEHYRVYQTRAQELE